MNFTFPTALFARFVLVAACVALLPAAHAQKRTNSFANDDDAFLALRDAARRGDAERAADIAMLLRDYPIPSYVDYYQLQPRIAEASPDEILDRKSVV